MLSRESKIGEVYKLDDMTSIIKLPRGVLIRSTVATHSIEGGVSIHTLYLSHTDFFGPYNVCMKEIYK